MMNMFDVICWLMGEDFLGLRLHFKTRVTRNSATAEMGFNCLIAKYNWDCTEWGF